MRAALALSILVLIAPSLAAANHAEIAAAARAALQRDDNEKAAELFEQAIKLAPKIADYHYYLGAAYGELAQKASLFSKAGLAKKCKAAFERAVELDPNHVDARLALIDYYLMAPGFLGGDPDKAMAEAAEIKKRNNVEGHRAYARIYTRQEKNDLARKELVDAVRENPGSARAHYLLAGVLINEKNYAEATRELEAALRLDPAYMPAHYRLGAAAALSGSDFARGEASLRKYLGYKPAPNEPGIAFAWYYLGMIQEKSGRKADAKASYAAAKKLAPESKDITEALKRVS